MNIFGSLYLSLSINLFLLKDVALSFIVVNFITQLGLLLHILKYIEH